MKKFLLSAAVLTIGTALGAATLSPRQPDDAGKSVMLSQAKERVTRIMHSPSVRKKAISYEQPSGEWTAWQQLGTGIISITNSLSFVPELEELDGDYEGITVESRADAANAGIQQFRIKGLFEGADIVADYYAAADGLLKIRAQATGITDETGIAVNILDFASCYEAISAEEMGMTEEELDEVVELYNSYNYYIPTLGRFYIFLGFMLDGETDAIAMADMTLQLDGYSDFTPKFGDATFFSTDNPQIEISLDPGVAYIKYGFFDGLANQKAINAVMAGGDGIGTVTADGKIAIPAGDTNRLRNITAITYDADDAALEWGYATFTVVDDEEGKWKSLGETDFTCDIFEGTMFKAAPSVFKTEIQQNIDNPGLYRLVNAFGETYPMNDSADEYDSSLNHYLVIDATDPELVLINLQHTGNDWGGGHFAVVSDAAYDISTGKSPESVKNMAGKLADGVITFPVNGLLIWCPDWEVFGGESGSLYISNASGATSIAIPDDGNGSVETIVAGNDSQVRYYNLQGIEIEHPQAGTLVIMKSGDKVLKTIAE